jgi:hypothetical protein
MDSPGDGLIDPTWTLVFCKKRGRWWVRLLAWGRYHHVKAVAYLPKLRAWLFYDVKFNDTRVLLANADAPSTSSFLQEYLENSDTIIMPKLPMPRRICPQLGFWCTIAMKHLVGIRSRALRPDRFWQDCIAAGGRPHANLSGSVLLRALRARIKSLRGSMAAPVPELKSSSARSSERSHKETTVRSPSLPSTATRRTDGSMSRSSSTHFSLASPGSYRTTR